MTYLEIVNKNKELKSALSLKDYGIAVLSNIIVNQSKEILEYHCRKQDVNASVSFGDYDNIVQDSGKFNSSTLVIVFWELCNLIDGLQYKANILSDEELNLIIAKTKSEIDFVLENLRSTPLVIFNKFSSLIFNHLQLRENNFDKVCDELNDYVKKKKSPHIFIADIDKVIARNGVSKSIDMRYYFSSKALYSVEFFKTYSEYILPVILSVNGKTKKALILDCDNTLWKGIIGEDGPEGIKMSGKSKEGVCFEYMQSIALDLNKQGVLLGLNSKNNPDDVNAVLTNHPDQKIKEEHLAIKKVNWQDKVSNLKAIANDLNIGADSFVMVDDSDFETNFIKENLPTVSVLQVPEKIYDYPFQLIAASQYFFNMHSTAEDAKKTAMYKEQSARENEKAGFTNVEDYLKSLELVVTISEDHVPHITRNAQLTQKTNQFNLTTKRYTEAEITKFIGSDDFKIFDFSLADKFGDYGITGISIVVLDKKNKFAVIDTFLMSCRVIGRNVEMAFMNHIMNKLKESGIETVLSSFIKTLKNDQVKDFYDRYGFENVASADQRKDYKLFLNNFQEINLPYIKVNLI
ncbi:MAG: HAD-IIIC family phosphatase [Bacteroidia bacterium]